MKRSFTYIILLYLLTIGCSGKSASVIGGANGSTEIIVADCDTDTILTGNDLEKVDSLFNAWVNNYNTNPITREKIGTISAIAKHGKKNHSLYHHPIARQKPILDINAI